LALNASKRAIGVEGEVMTKRDYSLLGPDGKRAVEIGLAAAEWYHTEVPRKVMKAYLEYMDISPEMLDTQMDWESWPENDDMEDIDIPTSTESPSVL
jgi:hypothetical protein